MAEPLTRDQPAQQATPAFWRPCVPERFSRTHTQINPHQRPPIRPVFFLLFGGHALGGSAGLLFPFRKGKEIHLVWKGKKLSKTFQIEAEAENVESDV